MDYNVALIITWALLLISFVSFLVLAFVIYQLAQAVAKLPKAPPSTQMTFHCHNASVQVGEDGEVRVLRDEAAAAASGPIRQQAA